MKNKKIKKRKLYQIPKIESKSVYEVNALGCAKCPTAAQISLSGQCIVGTKKFS